MNGPSQIGLTFKLPKKMILQQKPWQKERVKSLNKLGGCRCSQEFKSHVSSIFSANQE